MRYEYIIVNGSELSPLWADDDPIHFLGSVANYLIQNILGMLKKSMNGKKTFDDIGICVESDQEEIERLLEDKFRYNHYYQTLLELVSIFEAAYEDLVHTQRYEHNAITLKEWYDQFYLNCDIDAMDDSESLCIWLLALYVVSDTHENALCNVLETMSFDDAVFSMVLEHLKLFALQVIDFVNTLYQRYDVIMHPIDVIQVEELGDTYILSLEIIDDATNS